MKQLRRLRSDLPSEKKTGGKKMVKVKAVSGDTGYIEQELEKLIDAGWEIIDISTNLYDSSGGMRKETTVYLKSEQQQQ